MLVSYLASKSCSEHMTKGSLHYICLVPAISNTNFVIAIEDLIAVHLYLYDLCSCVESMGEEIKINVRLW